MQTVAREVNPRFHARTGCPVVVNTSFNVRDEPIVCTPAVTPARGSTRLAIGNCRLEKSSKV